MEITIRKAVKEDSVGMMNLVRELAIYEKAEDQVANTSEQMEIDGFGENPLFHAYLAFSDDKMIGLALYYYRYSTWKGKRLYLEDIVVTTEMRGKGAGKLLFDQVVKAAKQTKCTGMMWQVLDWNESAIEFYKKYGAQFDDSWVNCNLDF
jgi:GNAT superfamily N-acetyltransferase